MIERLEMNSFNLAFIDRLRDVPPMLLRAGFLGTLFGLAGAVLAVSTGWFAPHNGFLYPFVGMGIIGVCMIPAVLMGEATSGEIE